ncbi:acyltransferase family protein [Sphingomonas profundi]|uniref:acyltransferase family protein n=1 Tax=Alterirhizorhabdus profundi TaxID=2681549 RepID=UPI0018D16E44|nr:acyltransferase [Sphingomonas profundi]
MGRGRIVELDALRGLAALAVVLFHLTTRFDRLYGHASPPLIAVPWGHYGVQFFFGLSGFVIFMTLERTRHAADFVVSRVSRLYPAYWAAVLLTTAAVAIGPLPDLRHDAGTVLVNLTMVQGFLGLPYVDGVYWTLAIELAFYACMLGLFVARLLDRIEWVLIGWLGLKWLWWWLPDLSYAAGMLLVQDNIPFFAIGICAYRLHVGEAGIARVLPVLACALATIGWIEGAESLLVATLVAATFLGCATGRLAWLRWRPLAWLGGISYPLYLLHESIGFVLLAAMKSAAVPTDAAILIALLAALALGWAVSVAVERPALRLIRRAWRGAGAARKVEA